MTSYEIMTFFLYTAIGIVIGFCFCYLIKQISKYLDEKIEVLKIEELNNARKIDELDYSNRLSSITYTNELLKFIRMFIAQVAVIKMRSFSDNRDIKKVTRKNVSDLVQEVAKEVNMYINRNELNSSFTLLTPDFLDKYIIENTIIIVKDLFNKTIDDYDKKKELGLI